MEKNFNGVESVYDYGLKLPLKGIYPKDIGCTQFLDLKLSK